MSIFLQNLILSKVLSLTQILANASPCRSITLYLFLFGLFGLRNIMAKIDDNSTLSVLLQGLSKNLILGFGVR